MKFHANFQTSQYYKKPKDGGPTFTILHYAGPVSLKKCAHSTDSILIMHLCSKNHNKTFSKRAFLFLHVATLFVSLEQVTYETLGFLEKNRDTLKVDVSELLRASENQTIQSLFQTPLSRTGGLSPASTVSKTPLSATPLFSRKGPPMVGIRIVDNTIPSICVLVYRGTSVIYGRLLGWKSVLISEVFRFLGLYCTQTGHLGQ